MDHYPLLVIQGSGTGYFRPGETIQGTLSGNMGSLVKLDETTVRLLPREQALQLLKSLQSLYVLDYLGDLSEVEG